MLHCCSCCESQWTATVAIFQVNASFGCKWNWPHVANGEGEATVEEEEAAAAAEEAAARLEFRFIILWHFFG